jgi:lipid A 3-O-deacylase
VKYFPIKRLGATWLLGLLCCAPNAAAERSSDVLLGYGQSIPGFGDTTERLGLLDVAYRYRHVRHANVGRNWYQGNHELWLEFPVSLVLVNREDRDLYTLGMIGVNALFAWVFTGQEQRQPYILLGRSSGDILGS